MGPVRTGALLGEISAFLYSRSKAPACEMTTETESGNSQAEDLVRERISASVCACVSLLG